MASSQGFLLEVLGKAAHTRKPQMGIDAINIASHLVVALNTVMSKDIDPLEKGTFSIGTIEGGSASNVVADRVVLKGIIRSLDEGAKESILANIEKISRGLAEAFGGRISFNYHEGYPMVYNDRDWASWLEELFREEENLLYRGLEKPEGALGGLGLPLMSADDFGFISSKIPSVYYILGVGEGPPNHSPHFMVDEDYIKLATRTMALAALGFLSQGG